jgi:hypothetical protein
MNGCIRYEPLHMYCKTLVYTDEFGEVRGLVEEMPDGGLLLWEREFDCSEVRKSALLQAAEKRMKRLGRKCHISFGELRIQPSSG